MDLTRTEREEIADAIAEKVMDNLRAEQMTQKWLTIEEAIGYAKASRSTLKRWIDAGYIYGFKRTGKLIVDRESIDRWYSSERIVF